MPQAHRQSLTRRSALLLGAASILAASTGGSQAAHGVDGYGIIAVDWAAAETLVMAGIEPIGIADLQGFR